MSPKPDRLHLCVGDLDPFGIGLGSDFGADTKAGWLRHRVDQRTYVYQPTFSRDQESQRSLRRFIERVFHGNSQVVIQHLIEQGDLSEEDLLALQKLINRKRKEIT